MNKKSSILFQISLFFVIIIIIINILILVQFIIDNKVNDIIQTKRYFNALRIIKDGYFDNLSKKEINEKLKPYNISLTDIKIEQLRKNAKYIQANEDLPMNIYLYNGIKYINPNPPKFGKHHPPPPPSFFKDMAKEFERPFVKDEDLVFVDVQESAYDKSFWLIILFIIDILLIWFYFFIYNKLLPLQKLKNEIVKFSQGNLDINTKNIGKDEISQLANEFDNAISQLRELRKTKNLFLRNIMHELKTPITKGKLITDTLDNNRKKEILKKSFLRLEFLLEEFTKLDKITSGNIDLEKKTYRFIDILDQAIDMLIFDSTKLDIESENVNVCVDFEIFSIAIKNLIDNSIKYNTNGNPQINITKKCFSISNKGEPLKKPFEEYLTPFNREYESIDKGLGLGLYITNGILKKHNFQFRYAYKKGFHKFMIFY